MRQSPCPHSKGFFTGASLLLTYFLLGAALLLSACGGSRQAGVVLVPTEKQQVVASAAAVADIPFLVEGNTAFAVDLFRTLCAQNRDGSRNVVFSPYGASLVLAMTYAGSGGETEGQMADTLHFELPQERLHPAFGALDLELAEREGVKINVASSVWPFAMGRERLIPAFLDLVSHDYRASIVIPPENVNDAVRMINSWVSDATSGRVTEALPPNSLPQGQTAMVLVNALTFSGRWTTPFIPEATKLGSFHLVDGTSVQVPLMHHSMDYGYAEDESWQVVEIPYETTAHQRGDCSMVCLLPKDKTLDEAVADLTAEGLIALVESLDASDVVSLTMPRFAFDSSWQFKEICEALGMRDAFDPESANFSRMYKGGAPSGIWIDNGYQSSMISVDEEGTEAASSSIIAQVGGGSLREMMLDHPFLFVVRDIPTGAILFMGRVADPRG